MVVLAALILKRLPTEQQLLAFLPLAYKFQLRAVMKKHARQVQWSNPHL